MHVKLAALVTALVAALVVTPVLVTPPAAEAGVSAPPTAAPTHTLRIEGTGVATYPVFSPAVPRYGITSTEASTGTVTVTAKTSDSRGKVFIDGRLAPNGTRTVTGLEPNDEVSVIFKDAGGTKAHSAIYLPPGFPTLERTTPPNAAVSEGQVLMTLSRFTEGATSFETAVDRNGVPALAHEESSSLDFKRQPNGTLSASRESGTSPGRSGGAVVELGEDLTPLRTHETLGLTNTDGHDSILAADGSSFLIAYEPNRTSGNLDAVIQGIDPEGRVTFTWNSAEHVDIPHETVLHDRADYAHINSIAVTADGNLLASFRHFSAVFKIALRSEDGHQQGDVLWRLGGHRSDFDFAADPHYGPCAQHSASELPNGHILIFDNGSYGGVFGTFCIDPADPAGPEVTRAFTRITEYAIDESTWTATLVSSFTEDERKALFAGNVEQLADGHRIIGWASSRAVMATELAPGGAKLWELRDTNPTENDRLFTYRAHVTTIEDVTAPEVRLPVTASATFHRGQVVRPRFSCTDRGGSSLRACVTTGIVADRLDTSRTGRHTVRVTATDGAGNTSTQSRTYVVEPAHRPDAMLRATAARTVVGNDIYGSPTRQTITRSIRRGRSDVTVVRIDNDGMLSDRFRVSGTSGSRRFLVAYFTGGRNVTARVVAGTLRTPRVAAGGHWTMTVRVTRTSRARRGDVRTVTVRAHSGAEALRDAVAVRNRAR
ncbi:aryl-sulfate sulfotransferase [Nocardioides jensenii]|uniref:aryl-sulfate sulfotransferase n=1 Tax=Nocardioides jensenii TaxID=1843 RepID=UPI00082C4FBC|nr:aryl-sulfate sulfotransferase [Nocardioides jensenii]